MLNLRNAIIASASAIALIGADGAAYARGEAVKGEDGQKIVWNLPAQPLSTALIAWSQKADYIVLVQNDLTAGRRTEALAGSFSKFEALDRLLQSSGLAYEIKNKRTLVIAPRIETASFDTQAKAPNMGSASRSDPDPVQGLDDDRRKTRHRPDIKEGPTEAIVVTGTRIKGASPAAPMHVITRQEIERSGQVQTGALLRTLPQSFNGGISPTVQPNTVASNSGLASESAVNLRGMGPNATLVLIDGQRLAPISGGETVDVSAIPLSAISRVDVLLDGSSALYGADAVAGVVNFILQDSYKGAEVSAHAGGATQGGGFEQNYNAIAGRAWRDGAIMAGADYQNQEPISARDRQFSATAGPLNALLAGQEQWSTFASGHKDIGSAVSLHMLGLYTERQTGRTTEFAPGGFAVTGATDTKSLFLAPRAIASLPADWTMTLEGSFASSTQSDAEIDNFGGLFTTHSKNEEWSVDASFEGAVLRLPGGDLRAALGGGYRKDTLREDLNGAPRNGRRNVKFLFGEASAPLVARSDARTGLNSLDVDVAFRMEDHTGFGAATTPKVGVRYVPFSGLTLKGTWGKSFKAPLFDDLLAANVVTLWDAASLGSATPGLALFNFGGNPDLKPERATTWTAGFDWTPTFAPSLTLSFSYFTIDFKDRIISPIINNGSALSDPAYLPFIDPNPSLAEQNAIIGGADSFFNISGMTYDPAAVVAVVNGGFINASRQKARGQDISFNYRAGDLSLFGDFSHLRIDQQTLPTLPIARQSGFIFQPPSFRARSGASFEHGGFTATAIVNYISGSTDNVVVPSAKVSPWTTLDLSIQYEFGSAWRALNGLDASLSATNVLDNDPSFAAGGGIAFVGMNFDSANMSPIGRFIGATIRYRL